MSKALPGDIRYFLEPPGMTSTWVYRSRWSKPGSNPIVGQLKARETMLVLATDDVLALGSHIHTALVLTSSGLMGWANMDWTHPC